MLFIADPFFFFLKIGLEIDYHVIYRLGVPVLSIRAKGIACKIASLLGASYRGSHLITT